MPFEKKKSSSTASSNLIMRSLPKPGSEYSIEQIKTFLQEANAKYSELGYVFYTKNHFGQNDDGSYHPLVEIFQGFNLPRESVKQIGEWSNSKYELYTQDDLADFKGLAGFEKSLSKIAGCCTNFRNINNKEASQIKTELCDYLNGIAYQILNIKHDMWKDKLANIQDVQVKFKHLNSMSTIKLEPPRLSKVFNESRLNSMIALISECYQNLGENEQSIDLLLEHSTGNEYAKEQLISHLFNSDNYDDEIKKVILTKQALGYNATFYVILNEANNLLLDKTNFDLLKYKLEIAPKLSQHAKICEFLLENIELFDNTGDLTNCISKVLRTHQNFLEKLDDYISSTRNELIAPSHLSRFSMFQNQVEEDKLARAATLYSGRNY